MLQKASMGTSVFRGFLWFMGDVDNQVFHNSLDFRDVRVSDPEKAFFHTVRLQPNWFVDTNIRRFDFTNCRWNKTNGEIFDAASELRALEEITIKEPPKLLGKTCWQLADNHEETKSFREASHFREMAFESERKWRKAKLGRWKDQLSNIYAEDTGCSDVFRKSGGTLRRTALLIKSNPFDPIHFLYRFLSGYGERWTRAFGWLRFIWIFFAAFYALWGQFAIAPFSMDFKDSLGYSILVMTLQRPEPRPSGGFTTILYGIQTVATPIQGALLLLAIWRRFMR
jgi:hypothetical protein